MKVFYFLTCAIKGWFNNIGSDLKDRFSKSCKLEIFKVVLKDWQVVSE
jgi:hypothetical protein